jgi:DNA-binding NtrC family response regulator/tetratricopeptide (TPR) repeat protein
VLGQIARAEGHVTLAARHFESAIALAREADDPEELAWAHLYRFRLLIDSRPASAVSSVLPDVRRVVIKAGVPRVSAYLHICVSILEGGIGRRDEALRHCDIAASILELAPNAWLHGTNLVNRAIVACTQCDFSSGERYIRAAKQEFDKTGHAPGQWIIDINLGNVETLLGHFDRARQTFGRVLESRSASTLGKVAAREGLAQLYLAQNELESCDAVLAELEEDVRTHEGLAAAYHVGSALIARARLLLKRGNPQAALGLLRDPERTARLVRELPAAVQLVNAHASAMLGDRHAAARSLFAAADGSALFRELQAPYYYTSGAIVQPHDDVFAAQLRERALRLWSHHGIVSMRAQLDDGVSQPARASNDAEGTASTSRTVADAIAAALDLGYSPPLLGSELRTIIGSLDCSPDARIVENRHAANSVDRRDQATLPLGVHRRKYLTLVCRLPADPAKAILLADVLRVGRAALALEQARRDERSRAALWPASPVEEQAGALFLAEEMQALIATVRRIAPTNVPVLITGETGTGKEVLARMIHAYSPRAERSFLPFNCTATPKDMLDSQLFGHRRGAFTGASEHFAGTIRAAAGGTLFLDEIGETTLDIQPKLLRFLESSEVHPVGEMQPVRVDVRVIAATNADLDSLRAQGRFREDLFYRLNIVRLHVPPLRERRVEIPALAHHYLQKHAQEFRKGDLRLAEETMEYLVLYRWPGNVRQLANEIRRLAALAEPGAVLMPEHLSAEIAASRRTIPASQRALDPTEVVVRLDQPLAAALQHLERTMVQNALVRCEGRIEETAALLGVSRKGLYLKRLRYGLGPVESRTTEVA